jgi:glycosyltransferase involved in cell wall biosynthesis
VRLAVYTDYSYRQQAGVVYGERAFVLFLEQLKASFAQLVIVGRVDPEPGRSHYPIAEGTDFVGLPHYSSLTRPVSALIPILRSLKSFWRTLDAVDAVWLLGPHGLALPFALLAALRRKRIALGVRQDLPRYVQSRHPGRRWIHLSALVLEAGYRILARQLPVVVVGPELAKCYGAAARLLAMTVSLVREDEIVPVEDALKRSYDGELRVLSVGRLEREKNPLLLADVLTRVRQRDDRWRLWVCGEGPMHAELSQRLERLGQAPHAELKGYLPVTGGLLEAYRTSHALLHVSWTEGLPQVLFEAFAAGLPVVATAVGGVAEAVGEAGLLIAPGDPDAAAEALTRLAADPQLRARLIAAGNERAHRHTLEAESARVAEFLQTAWCLPPRTRLLGRSGGRR